MEPERPHRVHKALGDTAQVRLVPSPASLVMLFFPGETETLFLFFPNPAYHILIIQVDFIADSPKPVPVFPLEGLSPLFFSQTQDRSF